MSICLLTDPLVLERAFILFEWNSQDDPIWSILEFPRWGQDNLIYHDYVISEIDSKWTCLFSGERTTWGEDLVTSPSLESTRRPQCKTWWEEGGQLLVKRVSSNQRMHYRYLGDGVGGACFCFKCFCDSSHLPTTIASTVIYWLTLCNI